MTHHLKCDSRHWPDYKSGLKNNSIRKNDRNFAVGDIVILQWWMNNGFVTNEVVVKKVTHVLHDYDFKEMPEGFCILSLKD